MSKLSVRFAPSDYKWIKQIINTKQIKLIIIIIINLSIN